jgi:hypothetical protein
MLLPFYRPEVEAKGLSGVVVKADSGHDQFRRIECVELMQFTGLRDKGGVKSTDSCRNQQNAIR